MFIDNEFLFATAHSPSTSTATAAVNLSTNIVDIGPLVGNPGANLIRDIGTGAQTYLHILCTVAALSATSTGTIEFRLLTDDATTFASPAIMATTGALGTATQTAGVEQVIALSPGAYERYVGVSAFIVGVALTQGTWRYWINHEVQTNRAYAADFTVDV